MEKKKYSFLKGTIFGILLVVVVVLSAFNIFAKLGYIQIGYNGEIYVQDIPVTDGNEDTGIGTVVQKKLNSLEQVLDSFYFDDIDNQEAVDNIFKAYLSTYGDKYTVYYNAEEYQSLLESTNGVFYGIGVVVTKNDDGSIRVVEPYENAPGAQAGLQVGDRIVKINGESVLEEDLSTAVTKIKGAEGTTVDVEILRDGVAEPMTFTVTRSKVEVPTISSEMLEDNIGYIAISGFEEVTEKQFIDTYDNMLSQGMKGLIVDIRSNPGGRLDTVINILDKILPDGLIVYTEDKNGKRVEYSGQNSDEINIPLAVLVNGDSASASEIFAGAIQDYEVGTIIGTQTFGKGIVQTIRPLTDGSAIKFTIAKYFTPKGQDIHGKGVTPDIEVEIESGMAYSQVELSEDTQYQKALSLIKEQIAN